MRGAAIVVLMVLLAGCSGKAPEPEQEVEPVFGALLVDVANEAGLAVPDARASLVGADAFGDTNATGQVLLADVPPGTHKLSVQAGGFEPHLQEVEVTANETRRVEVTLFLVREGNPPHIHSHWPAGRDTYVLMDADVDMTRFSEGTYPEVEDPVFGPTLVPNGWSDGDFRIPILESPENGPTIVLPGTRQMDFTLDWDTSEVNIPEFGIMFDPSNSGEFETLETVGPGGTISIDVTPEMWDDAHRLFSRWHVRGYHENDVTDPTGWQPAVAGGPLHVTITLHKGELTLDPAHKDFWGGNDTIRLLDFQGRSGTVPFGVGYSGKVFHVRDEIVPPGTGMLRMVFRWEAHQANGTAPGLDFGLWWTSPDQNPQTTTRGEAWTVEPASGGADEQQKVYELTLEEAMTDGFYDTNSGWTFFGRPMSHEQTDLSIYGGYHMDVRVDAIRADG